MFRIFMMLALLWAPYNALAERDILPVVSGEWPPYVGRELPDNGFFAAIVHAALNAAELDWHFKLYPWARGQFLVRSGQVFGTFPYVITPLRQGFAWFSDPIAFEETVLLYKPARIPHFAFENLQDLKPLKVGGTKGFFYQERFKQAGLNVRYVGSETAMLALLMEDKVDCVPINRLVGRALLQKHYPAQANQVEAFAKPIQIESLHLMVSRRYPEAAQYLEKFNAGLATIKENGTYDRLMERVGG